MVINLAWIHILDKKANTVKTKVTQFSLYYEINVVDLSSLV
jgi:hypothetical protein